MYSQQYIQRKTPSNASSTPVPSSLFRQRPFNDEANQAMVPPQQQEMPDLQTQLERAKRFGHNFSQVQVLPDTPSSAIQTKFTVGAPGDKYEQEADSVASQVMNMAAPGNQQSIQRDIAPEQENQSVQAKPLASSITPLIQRETAPQPEEVPVQTKSLSGTLQRETAPQPEQEEPVQTKSLSGTLQRETAPQPEQEEPVQTKRSLDGNSQTSSNLESQLTASKGSGSALPDEVRAFMEPRFGSDFSQVRVHTDSQAVQMNKELGAQAFTHGHDIYFGAGKSPDKSELTAHELTHVVQQTGAVQPKYSVNGSGAFYNQQVDRVATQIMRQPTPAPAPGVFPPSPPPPSTLVAKLKLHADTETVNRSALTFKELQNAQVGHSWVSLEYNGKAQIPNEIQEPTKSLLKSGGTAFGFWPLINRADQFTSEEQQRIDQGQTPGAGASDNPVHTGFSLNPFKWVPGRVEEPDTAHTPKGTKEYELNQNQVNSLLQYVNSKRNANYNLYRFNCSTFAVECVQSAGQNAPSGSSWGITLPNALYSDLYQMSKKGDKSVTLAPLDLGEKHEQVEKENKR